MKTALLLLSFWLTAHFNPEQASSKDNDVKERHEANDMKHRIDSLKSAIVNDTAKFEIVFFDINSWGDAAFGCHVVLNHIGLTSNSFKIHTGGIDKYRTPKRLLNQCSEIIKEFFYYPERFMKKPEKEKAGMLSHDNEIYLFFKTCNNVLINEYFMRSVMLNKSNEQYKTLIMHLGGLY